MDKYAKKFKNWQTKPFIKQLIKKLPKAEAFLVGGAVRDAILGRKTKDFDLVIRNANKNNLEKLLKTQGKVSLVGKKFGVFKFKPKNSDQEFDIALPRTEHSISFNGIYKDFKIQSNAKLKITDDLSRRDFTINAMAWDIINEKLIDPFNGLGDLKKGLIKTVGSPAQRFKEDYSRILRALRFACQLNFEIETKTWQEIKKQAKNLNKINKGQWVVAREIIAKELIKAISAHPVWTLELLDQSGALKILIPELLKMKGCPQPKNWHSEGDVWKHTILGLEILNSKIFQKEFSKNHINNELIWGVIFHDIGKPFTIKMADRLRFNNHDFVSAKKFKEVAEKLKLSSGGLDVEIVEKIISKHMILVHSKVHSMKETTLEKYFFNENFPGQQLLMLSFADISATIPQDGKPDYSTYKKLKSRINKLNKKGLGSRKLPKPLINGNDLIEILKVSSGPKIGKLLKIAREAQLKGAVKTKKTALNYIKKYL